MRSVFIVLLLTLHMVSCSKDVISSDINGNGNNENNGNENGGSSMSVKITIGNSTFAAILADNSAATAFKTMLPLTLNMGELNGNEKYATLSNNLPTRSVNIGRVQNGDLMLFGSSTLVLFYETFSTSYSYTPIARIAAPQQLPAAVGSRDVIIKFELYK